MLQLFLMASYHTQLNSFVFSILFTVPVFLKNTPSANTSVVSDGETFLTFLNMPTLIKESRTSECRYRVFF